MRLPAGPARFLKTRYLIAALIVALVPVASTTGFVWADLNVTVVVDGVADTITTRAEDVASVLSERGVRVREGDLVSPSPASGVADGDVIVVRHAIPVTLRFGGETHSLRVLGRTVGDALIMAGLDPAAGASVDPSPDTLLEPGMTITAADAFVRVVEEEGTLPYSSVVQGDPTLPAGSRKVLVKGAPGRALRIWQVVVTDGVEGQRTLKTLTVLTPAVDEVVAIGTKQAFRQVVKASTKKAKPYTPGVAGQVLSVRTTAYTPWDRGCVGNTDHARGFRWVRNKLRNAPRGWGIIAVDPHVIPLGSKVFVDGYGYAIACDTGGAIKGKKIDVCFWGPDTGASTMATGGYAQIRAARTAAMNWGARNGKRTIRVTILGK